MREFDELNTIQRVQDIDTYFDEMDLTDEQKEERKSAAHDIEDMMIYILALIAVMSRYNAIDEEFIRQQIKERYAEAVEQYNDIDDYIRRHIETFSDDVVRSTIDNIDEQYFLSDDRATYLGENESESYWEYQEYDEAIAQGKTMKEWVDMRDKRERETHLEVGGTKIPIQELFIVGDSVMRFCKDDLAEAKEVINCRCHTRYY